MTVDITLGEGGSREDLQDRQRVVAEKVERDAQEIIEVLKRDFPAFIERQTKERYRSAPPSFELGADHLKKVKASVQEAGEKATAEILPKLEDLAIWTAEDLRIPAPADRKDLRGNPRVHGHVQEVGRYLHGVLVEHGFPGAEDEGFDDAYKLPSWFIGGKLLVSLVESYWRNLEELQNLRAALRELVADDARQRRGDAWDQA